MGGYGMKRNEEIIVEAQKYGLNCMSRINYQDGFIKGAKWADKTMIEKCCSYLYAKSKMSGSEINSFIKAMED